MAHKHKNHNTTWGCFIKEVVGPVAPTIIGSFHLLIQSSHNENWHSYPTGTNPITL